MRQDYVTTARAKGLSERNVIWRHILRNALITIVTILGLQLGALLNGSVITETVFSRPGLGKVTVDAVLSKDLPVVLAVAILSALIYVVMSTLVDILALLLDPRLRHQPGRE